MVSNRAHHQSFSPGKVIFIDGSNKSRKSERVKEKRARIMNRKPTFDSTFSSVDASIIPSQPALATNYQVQVTNPYQNQPNDFQHPTSTKFSHNHSKDVLLSSSYSAINPSKPLRNRLSNVGYVSPQLDLFDQNQLSGVEPLGGYSFDHIPPEQKVNYQIQIQPAHHSKKNNYGRPSKELQTPTAYNNFVSHFLPGVTPLQKPAVSTNFNPPKPIFGFRPNFHPFPLEGTFLHRRGAFQKSGSFNFPSFPNHVPNVYDNFQHLQSTGGIHLPRYGYLIYNPKRGPPFYIIPEVPFQIGIDNEFHPTQLESSRSAIKPTKFS